MLLSRLLKNDIAKEASRWVAENIINERQAERICAGYGVDYQRRKIGSRGYNVLVGLGFLFIALAVIVLIGNNWDDIPRELRMWALIAITMATQGMGISKYLCGERSAAAGIFFLGNFFFGAAIILIAQTYHLGERMEDGVFWWALGCLPFALLTNNVWITLQSVLLALIWFVMEVTAGFSPMLFLIFAAAAVAALCRAKKSLVLLFATALSVLLWFEYALAELWRDGRFLEFRPEHVAATAVLFIFANALGGWLSQSKRIVVRDYGAALSVWTLRLGVIFLLAMSFEVAWKELLQEDWRYKFSMLTLVATLALGALSLARQAGKLATTSLVLFVYASFLMSAIFWRDVYPESYFQIADNLALVAAGVWLIIKGLRSGLSHYFYLGIVAFLLIAFSRYIDLIGGYIGGAILFMVFAALILASAKYWKASQAEKSRA